MQAHAIVDRLLEADIPLPDAKATQRMLRKMFVPGSQWQRINYRFPTKQLGQSYTDLKVIPPGQPVTVKVVKAIVDAIVFQLPDGQTSYLTYPDQEIVKARQVYPTGVEFEDTRGPLLSYRPV